MINIPAVWFPLQDEVHLVVLTPKHLQQLAPEPLCLSGLPNATFFLFLPLLRLLLIPMVFGASGGLLSLRRALFPEEKQNKK